MRWRRRAGRSSGKRGRFRLAKRLPTADSLCSLKVARASKISADGNFRRPLVGSLRAFTSAEMAALRCIAAARMGFLLAALHSVAKRVSRGQAYHPTVVRPRCPKTAPHASAATIRSFVPLGRAIAACPLEWKRSQDSGVLVLAEPLEARDSSPSSGKWGPAALASTRGPCGAGGRAFRGLTRSATEWSAARRKPVRAAAMHLSAAISADVRPVGFRRAAAENCRPAIFEARATLREQSGSTLGRRVYPQLCPRLLGIEECPRRTICDPGRDPTVRVAVRVCRM